MRTRGGSALVASGFVAGLLALAALALALLSTPRAAGASEPHGGYSSSSSFCTSCHKLHGSPSAESLLIGVTVTQTCYTCHDGTGASSNVKGEFGDDGAGGSTRASSHPVPTGTLFCNDCHSPHKGRSDDVRLLRIREPDGSLTYSPPGTPIGNPFCYSCHGTTSTHEAPLGDHSAFDNSIHNTSADVPDPPSGSGIKCLACHTSHGSDSRRLQAADGPALCYTCHTPATPRTSGGSNPYVAFTAAPNDYSIADGNGVRIFHHPVSAGDQAGETRVVSCSSCHNSHLVDPTDDKPQGKSKIEDPSDFTSKYLVTWDSASFGMNRSQQPGTAEDVSTFCTRCHVNPATVQPLTAGPSVPYTVRLVDDSSTDAGNNRHDKFSASQYFTGGNSIHGRDGQLACTACHDFHGSSNAYMLRETVVSVGTVGVPGGQTTTMTGFQASFTDYDEWVVKFRGFCAGCHSPLHGDYGAPCISCHFHGSSDF